MKAKRSVICRTAISFTAIIAILSVTTLPSVGQLATREIALEAKLVNSSPVIDDILPSGKKSDGCTLIPDGHIRDCCVAHDREYFFGGTEKERRAADERLYKCIRKKKGAQHKFLAPFIWLGVRIGGVSFLPTPFRWGFGKKEKTIDKPPQPPVTNP